jgi:secreted PhoX family phosphatase
MRRSEFLRAVVVGMGALALDPIRFSRALAATCSSSGPYGPLRTADANGIRLPTGFTSRVVAESGVRVTGTSYTWHGAPDGGATFALSDKGWVYCSNSERPNLAGGAGSIRFASNGTMVGAHRILSGTNVNCAGGPTPWGTWLSCEEVTRGRVFECHPLGQAPAVARLALGRFKHEAAAVDGSRGSVYLTEDEPDGRFYRFRYPTAADLSSGTLEVAIVGVGGSVTWRGIPDPSAAKLQTRYQVPDSTVFLGGEGAWYGNGVVHFTTKGDNKVWAYSVATNSISVIYDINTSCNPVLAGVDNVVVSRSGDIFVAEDGGDMQLVLLGPDGSVSAFLQLIGQGGSEITGPAFSPPGNRLYLSSQRGGPNSTGITYEIKGPFRTSA